MDHNRIAVRFQDRVKLEDVAASLLLASWAVEGLHGAVALRLEGEHHLDPRQRTCTFDVSRPVGRDLVRVFLALVQREFTPDLYCVEHPGMAPLSTGMAG